MYKENKKSNKGDYIKANVTEHDTVVEMQSL